MRYYETDFLIIETEDEIAIMKWLGLAKTDNYRAGHNQFTELLKESPSKLWLFDYQQGKVIDVKDQGWTVEEWFPEALEVIEKDLQKIAVIMSKDIFNKVSVRIITDKISKQFDMDIAFFESSEDAKEWLAAPAETSEVTEIEQK